MEKFEQAQNKENAINYDDVPVPEGINEAALKAAVVENTSFDDLADISCKIELFLENTK